MSTPSTLTITFTGGSGSPATVNIPTPAAGVPQDYTQAVRNIFLNGGFWMVLATGANQFVPWGAITSIIAQ